LTFREGEGPVLEPILDAGGIARLDLARAGARLAPVFDAVNHVAAVLDRQTALIGFAGSPWTVATYMVEGGASRDFRRVKGWSYRDPAGFGELIELLTEGTIMVLSGQIEAGAEVVQLFDSWAGTLPEAGFERWVIGPTTRIVAALRRKFPNHPIVGFPRGAGVLYERYARESGIDAVGLDPSVPADFAVARLQPFVTLQGNLDPVLLVSGGAALEAAVSAQRRTLGGGPWVFNLGHGVLPETPPENIATLARLLARPGAA
jgi:uroporphyrinogen decarboxylase